jgi:hypothetical protein
MMNTNWAMVEPDVQHAVSREALCRARQVIAAQANLLAEKMEGGLLMPLDGPDSLRLLAMMLEADESVSLAA